MHVILTNIVGGFKRFILSGRTQSLRKDRVRNKGSKLEAETEEKTMEAKRITFLSELGPPSLISNHENSP